MEYWLALSNYVVYVRLAWFIWHATPLREFFPIEGGILWLFGIPVLKLVLAWKMTVNVLIIIWNFSVLLFYIQKKCNPKQRDRWLVGSALLLDYITSAGRVFFSLSFWMVFLLLLESESTGGSSLAFVTIIRTEHCPWTVFPCSNSSKTLTTSVSQSRSTPTNHDGLEICLQDGSFAKAVLRKKQHWALIVMQQCTPTSLNYSAKFSYLIKTKTKKWFKARIAYYPNSVATFNFNALTISLCGGVHPLPGPTSRSISKIPVRCTDYKRKNTSCCRTREEWNCTKMKSTRYNSSSMTLSQLLDLCLWNVRSLKGKVLSLKDYTVEHDLEFLDLTETWLHSGECDNFFVGELCPKTCIFHHTPRANSTGGGVGILVKKSHRVKTLCSANFSSFEHMVALAEYPIRSIRISVIYRPPSSQIERFSQTLLASLSSLSQMQTIC